MPHILLLPIVQTHSPSCTRTDPQTVQTLISFSNIKNIKVTHSMIMPVHVSRDTGRADMSARCGLSPGLYARLTTQTLPLPWCFGFAGHIGLLGRCSGRSNSKKETSSSGSLPTDSLGVSRHSVLPEYCPLRCENTRGIALSDPDESLESSFKDWVSLVSIKKPRWFPFAAGCSSGEVLT